MPKLTGFEGILLDNHIRIGDLEQSGQFGHVFRGKDERSGNEVAVKVLKAGTVDPSAHAEFLNEGELLEKLADCSNVVDLDGPPGRTETLPGTITTASGSQPIQLQIPYLVMEWMDVSLAEMLTRRDELEWHERLWLVRQVAKGVHQMHLKEVFHRDLKSDNILVRLGRKSTYIVKVADLGRSRDFRKPQQVVQEAYAFGRGHLLHAPPECLWGLATGNSRSAFRRFDLYLLGSVLFELTTGLSITSVVFPKPHDLVMNAQHLSEGERRADYEAAANAVRAQFVPAFTMFESQLPQNIQQEGSRLMRQLCDPRPDRRDYQGNRPRKQYEPGLNWLLMRLDILTRQCAPRQKPAAHRAHGSAS
jgi:serine/threonine protein kinase